jgi:hypothetical protein
MSSGWMRFLLVAAVALGLSGCVAYPAGPYGYGYGYAPYYYGPPVAGTVVVGGGGWHRGCCWR